MPLSKDDRRYTGDLIQRITGVFGIGKRPSGTDLIPDVGERDAGEVTALRRRLGGRTWDLLSQDWLREHWASFCYFAPQGYRHFLPALLCGALRDVRKGGDLVHSTVFSLQPSYWAIYWRGADREHEARVAALTRAEYDLVCEFLGFMQRLGHAFLAAEALRWGWSRHDTPHHAGMHAHYERMFGHVWPDPEDPAAAAVAQQVLEAFADTVCPADDALCGSKQGDEPAEYALEFRGRDWRTLHPEFLQHNYASLAFFTDEGYRYFLPAYVMDELWGSDTNADPVSDLTGHVTGTHGADSARAIERLAGLDHSQCEALVAFLRHRQSTEAWDQDRKQIERALEHYWLPRLNKSP